MNTNMSTGGQANVWKKKREEELTDQAQFDADYARAKADYQQRRDSFGTVQQSAASGGYAGGNALQLANQLASQQNSGGIQTSWGQTLNDAWNKIQNREKFSYDLNGDALYQQYKDQYVTQGQQAMMDTMGQAAALTGGYGNSYAQTAGQQTFQGYLQELNNKVPELYQLALDQYNREGDELYNQYALVSDRENTEYNRAYLAARDAVSDSQWQAQFDEGVRQYDTSLGWDKEKTGMEYEHKDKVLAQEQSQFDAKLEYDYKTLEVQQTQWQAEFDETVKNNQRNYELAVEDINEQIRHNTITEEQGAQQIALAWAEKEANDKKAADNFAYQMASIGLNPDGTEHKVTGISNQSKYKTTSTNSTTTKKTDTTPVVEPDPEPEPTTFSGKTYSEAVSYMESKGVAGARASGIRTQSEFNKWSGKSQYDSYAHYLSHIVEYNIEKYGK